MSKLKRVASTVLAALAISFTATANAEVVVVNFNNLAVQYGTVANVTTQGVTFSPNCHYDIEGGTSNWMGFDGSGGCGNNPNYLGGSHAAHSANQLFVTPGDGKVFSLQSLLFRPTFSFGTGFFVETSAGGFREVYEPSGVNGGNIYTFSGAEFTNLSWIMFSNNAGTPVGFDDLTLDINSVPEPSAVALLLLALGAFGMSRHVKSRR